MHCTIELQQHHSGRLRARPILAFSLFSSLCWNLSLGFSETLLHVEFSLASSVARYNNYSLFLPVPNPGVLFIGRSVLTAP